MSLIKPDHTHSKRQYSSVKISAIEFLLTSQNQDGGWGYYPGQASTIEPTSSSIIALSDNDYAPTAYNMAIDHLLNAQNNDGGWGIRLDDSQSGWQTAWALLALDSSEVHLEEKSKAIDWLVSTELFEFSDDETQAKNQEFFAIDLSLRGWPWRPGETAWVEPTALAILALAGFNQPPSILERIDEGVLYLNDRRCNTGGWNVGSPTMFSVDLVPRAQTSALSLLALNKVAPQLIQSQDITALRTETDTENRPLAYAWSLLALQSLNEINDDWKDLLIATQKQDGSWNGNIYFTSIALMAIANTSLTKI